MALGLVTLTLVAAAVVLVLVLARPAAMEARGRNAWVGIRIPSTMASDEAWVAGHRAAWPLLRAGSVGALVLVAGLAVLWWTTGRDDGLLALGVVGVTTLWGVAVCASAVPASRAAREVGP
ncbi:SdpI family protein [Pseudokineococcus sp. 1T1Z-3]|uniref:SdpI family protein n=1 Tax=Pseudokineococcus sp. 1T1Z-3 TaxID=3132745 RepID=UPI0030B46964